MPRFAYLCLVRPLSEEGHQLRWLAVAVALHAGALFAAHRMEPRRAPLLAPIEARLEIDAERLAAVAKDPEPPPPRPRVDEALGASPRPVKAPPVERPRASKPAPTTAGPKDKEDERFVRAVAAEVAQAAAVLTSTQGNGPPFATGAATSTYGLVAGSGSGTTPTIDPRAGFSGGAGARPPDPPEPDRSRPASVSMGFTDECDFPSAADRARVDKGWAYLVVTVRANGTAARVQVLSDSGYGFGAAAKVCAERARYGPALDRKGKPIEQDTPPFRYRFTR
jgi:protein TonB